MQLLFYYVCFVLEPPVISQPLLPTYAITGDAVMLQCRFTSTTPVTITWSKTSLQNVVIAMDSRITITSSSNSGELRIRDATRNDSGLYSCTGVTIAGTAVTTAELVIGSK